MNKIRPLTLDSLNENIFSRIKNRVSGMFRKPARTPFVPTPPSPSQRKALTIMGRTNVLQQKGTIPNPQYDALSTAHKEKLGDIFRGNLATRDQIDYMRSRPKASALSGPIGPSYRRLRKFGISSEPYEKQRREELSKRRQELDDKYGFRR